MFYRREAGPYGSASLLSGFYQEYIDKKCIYVYNHTRIHTHEEETEKWKTEKFF